MGLQIVVLGTAEWDAPIRTNQHYVTEVLAEFGSVAFVESLGLRRIRLNRADLNRVLKRLFGASKRTTAGVNQGIKVIHALAVPAVYPGAKYVNKRLLAYQLRRRGIGIIDILWTYTPVTNGLLAHSTVYHCVDLLSHVRGIDAKLISRSEGELARRKVRAIGTSHVVCDHLLSLGFSNVDYWPNVADVPESGTLAARGDRRGIVFCGNLTADKLDFDILLKIAIEARNEGIPVVLAGPDNLDGNVETVHMLSLLRNYGVIHAGVVTSAQMPRFLADFVLGVIPYRNTEYTRGVFPLKLFEYLAAGLAVVSTDLPSIRDLSSDFHEHVFICSSASDFVNQVLSIARNQSTEDMRRTRYLLAAQHSWTSRAVEVRALVQTVQMGEKA